MKTSGTCPKCKSIEVVNVDNRMDRSNHIHTGVLSTIEVQKYICCDCGYVEDWVENIYDLKEIKRKFG